VRPEVAIPSMSSSDVLFNNFPFERDVLARAYVAGGHYDEAIAEYEALVAFDPAGKDRRLVHPVFHYRLGVLCAGQGLVEKAASQYERYLEIVRAGGETLREVHDARRRLESLTNEELGGR
jgi:tetratricopeptide (TPR) repeat protein